MFLLAACSGAAPRSDAATQAIARSVSETASRAALRPGVRACRQLRVAIAEREWIRGEVVSAGEKTVRIRIEEPGEYRQAINGVLLAKGAIVEDSPLAWTPCL